MKKNSLVKAAGWGLLFCFIGQTRNAGAEVVSVYARKDILRRAKVWRKVDVASRDTLNGPQGEGAYAFNEKVPCKYEEKDPMHPLGGHSSKFPCWDASGERLKVKYNHSEVFGEVAATRLFWALGFYAERMYSVQIVCENCPKDPWTDDGTQKRATRTFSMATVQKRLKGTPIEYKEGLSWGFDELKYISEKSGGSSKAEVDALKLLSVLVNHVDNTANQQLLLCPEGDANCAHPIAYVTDLGGTFGGQNGTTNFRNWSRKKSVWKDPKKCVADFKGTSADYRDPKISEGGRKFLSGLLEQLTDKQLYDLFKSARFDVGAKEEYPIVTEGGKARSVTIDDWVREFKRRRKEIAAVRCPK